MDDNAFDSAVPAVSLIDSLPLCFGPLIGDFLQIGAVLESIRKNRLDTCSERYRNKDYLHKCHLTLNDFCSRKDFRKFCLFHFSGIN